MEGDLVDLAAELNVINKSGAWFTYGEMKLGQGRDNARQYLIEHKELIDEIKTKVLAAKGLA
jgi:recombination protein RecA